MVIMKTLIIQWLYFTKVGSDFAYYMQHPFVITEQVESHRVFHTSVTVRTIELNPITCYSFVPLNPFYNKNLATIRKFWNPSSVKCRKP